MSVTLWYPLVVRLSTHLTSLIHSYSGMDTDVGVIIYHLPTWHAGCVHAGRVESFEILSATRIVFMTSNKSKTELYRFDIYV